MILGILEIFLCVTSMIKSQINERLYWEKIAGDETKKKGYHCSLNFLTHLLLCMLAPNAGMKCLLLENSPPLKTTSMLINSDKKKLLLSLVCEGTYA
jgi:hypothetical protein